MTSKKVKGANQPPKPIFFFPVDPSKPLPYPPAFQKETGTLCNFPVCSNKVPHSTVYYKPSNRPHLIGIRCRFETTKSYKTYKSDHYHSELFNYNHQSNNGQLSTSSQISKDHQFAMSLFKLINSDVPLPEIALTPPASQLSTRVPAERHCRGYLGNFAVEHTLKMNSKCNIDACFACCHKLNMNVASCAAHHGKVNKRKLTVPESQGSQNTDASNTIHTQAGQLYTRKLEEEEYAKFRGISIKKQAEERIEQAGIELSNKTVTLVVWPGGSLNPLASRLFRVHAPQWPRLALKQSELLIKLITKQLGEGWDEGIQVWSIAERNWVTLQLGTVETYTFECRKILIHFPDVEVERSPDFQEHMDSLSVMAPKATLDISRFLTHINRSPKESKYRSNTTLSTSDSDNEVVIFNNHGKVISDDSDSEVVVITKPIHGDDWDSSDAGEPSPLMAASAASGPNGFPPPPPIPSSSNPELTSSQKWPAGVTMRTMKAFLDATMDPHKELVRDAWHRMFGNHYIYRPSTVTHYRRWLMYINPVELNNYVARFGNLAVRQGQTHFKEDWAKCDKRYGQRPSKRSR
ncbi:hypothetical protein DFH28DRAFT_891516 [Melampsora americana]|nr:hypothetical protein DFH28DRAFT_891516 [Melampsora americana]